MMTEVGSVCNNNNRIRTLDPVHPAFQDVYRDALVFRDRNQAVDSWEIDYCCFFSIFSANHSGMVFHGDAGKIANLLA
jgi:hypothetical protein